MQRKGVVGVGLFAAAVGVASCTSILGIDEDYVDVGEGGHSMVGTSTRSGAGGDAATTGAATGAASTGAASTGAASTGAGAGSTGSGAVVCTVTHPGGGECEYLPGQQCGCLATQKCSVAEETTGKSLCLTSGALGLGQKCVSDAACQAGAWCDHFTGTCEKICNDVGNCVAGAKCTAATNAPSTTAIPGLKVCTANCDPISASQCGTGVTCAFDTSAGIQGFDCFVSGLKKEGDTCAASKDCGKGLVCVAGASSTCQRWCSPVNTKFPDKNNSCFTARPNCVGFGTPFIRNGVEYGSCDP